MEGAVDIESIDEAREYVYMTPAEKQTYLLERDAVKALADKIRKTPDYKMGIGRATALYMARGDYNGSEAHKMALHLVTQQAKKHYGAKYFDTYTPEVRLQVQKKLAAYARKDAPKLNHLLPKKYQKGFDGYEEGYEIVGVENVGDKKVRVKIRGNDEATTSGSVGGFRKTNLGMVKWHGMKFPVTKKKVSEAVAAVDKKVLQQLNKSEYPEKAEKGKGFCFHWADGRGICGFKTKTAARKWLTRENGDTMAREVVKFWYGEPTYGKDKKKSFKLSESADMVINYVVEVAGVGFANDKKPMKPSKAHPKGYVATGKEEPIEEPEPEVDDQTGEEIMPPQYPFTLNEIQAYYDLQIAMGKDTIEGVRETRKKFKLKDIRVSPVGEVLPIEGLKEAPKPAPPPPEEDLEGEEEEEEEGDGGATDTGGEEEPPAGPPTKKGEEEEEE